MVFMHFAIRHGRGTTGRATGPHQPVRSFRIRPWPVAPNGRCCNVSGHAERATGQAPAPRVGAAARPSHAGGRRGHARLRSHLGLLPVASLARRGRIAAGRAVPRTALSAREGSDSQRRPAGVQRGAVGTAGRSVAGDCNIRSNAAATTALSNADRAKARPDAPMRARPAVSRAS